MAYRTDPVGQLLERPAALAYLRRLRAEGAPAKTLLERFRARYPEVVLSRDKLADVFQVFGIPQFGRESDVRAHQPGEYWEWTL